jgi:hypothetical protein
MKQKKRLAWPLMTLGFLVLLAGGYVHANDADDVYRQIATILVPGNLASGFDISWVDSVAGRYYLADRAAPASIDVIDTKHDRFLGKIPLANAGNGVVSISNPHDDVSNDPETAGELWVGENLSTVEVIDLKTRTVVAAIPTGGVARSDELAYDPLDHIVLIANDRETACVMGVCTGPAPFVTFISTESRSVLGTITYDGSPGNGGNVVFGDPLPDGTTGPTRNHGLEQPVWNPKTQMFYLAVPGTVNNPGGEVDEIDAVSETVNRVFPTNCSPAGLVLVPHQRLVTSCGDVIRVRDGAVLTTVANVGGDEIWYNPGEERVYFGGFQFVNVPILNVFNFRVVANLVVGVFNPPTTFQTTHSVAADSENNRIFVPVSNVGVKVYINNALRRTLDDD